jgi:predicted small secreted protein
VKTKMIPLLKRLGLLLLVTTVLAIVGIGCNTAHGFGKDVSNTGDAIQKGTK